MVAGVDDGDFAQPMGIAIDHEQYVYVADYNNFRIQKFDTEGTFQVKWGSTGSGDDQFNWPQGVAIDNTGNVYVADRGNRRFTKFDPEGHFIAEWKGEDYPNTNGFACIEKMDADGNGNIYAVDSCNHHVFRFNSNGQLTARWGSYGTGNGEFNGPTGVAADESGNVFVVDYYNNRIQKFTSNGDFIAKWGKKGSGDGEFDFERYSPPDGVGIAVDGNGYVYVTDGSNNRIQKFTSEGEFVSRWGTEGMLDGQFFYARGIAVDKSGNVYVSDDSCRVQKFTGNGKFIWILGGFGYNLDR